MRTKGYVGNGVGVVAGGDVCLCGARVIEYPCLHSRTRFQSEGPPPQKKKKSETNVLFFPKTEENCSREINERVRFSYHSLTQYLGRADRTCPSWSCDSAGRVAH